MHAQQGQGLRTEVLGGGSCFPDLVFEAFVAPPLWVCKRALRDHLFRREGNGSI
jgi:hypothetical protein